MAINFIQAKTSLALDKLILRFLYPILNCLSINLSLSTTCNNSIWNKLLEVKPTIGEFEKAEKNKLIWLESQ